MLRALLLVSTLTAASPAASLQTPADDPIAIGFHDYETDDLDGAYAAFERGLAEAEAGGDAARAARAHRGLGTIWMQRAKYDKARAELDQARALAGQSGDRLEQANLQRTRAALAILEGNWTAARAAEQDALTSFQALDDPGGQAAVLLDEERDPETSDAARTDLLTRALSLAERAGRKRLQADIEHAASDLAFSDGDYATAMRDLQDAITLLEQINARFSLARALTSLGRLYRVHGEPAKAIAPYRRALALQRRIEDQQGTIQTINALAIAYDNMDRRAESLRLYVRALALARRTGSPRIVAFQLGNLGGAYLVRHQYQRAASILREALKGPESDYIAAIRHDQLAEALENSGHAAEAVDEGTKAIDYWLGTGNADEAVGSLQTRAGAYRRLGRLSNALEDVRNALKQFEIERTHLVPSDVMKQGYTRRHQDLFALAVEILFRTGDERAALETAGEAEGRAFLDLLASRHLRPGAADGTSTASAPAPSLAEIKAVAARRRTSLLAYFVTERATYAWVVSRSGEVHAARLPITRARLVQLIRRTRPADVPNAAPAERVAMRGGQAFFAGATDPSAWSRLYTALVQPIRHWMPADGRITVVPHGPLFLLSFAGLKTPSGRYLVEDYAIHYVPSIAVLRFTADSSPVSAAERYLLVGDPTAFPETTAGEHLAPLPGARRELRRIAALLPEARTTILSGAKATEEQVEADLGGVAVAHFATHAIVRDDDPLGSYLALEPDASSDGRLTAASIYGLKLAADEVVLSACGTALGQLTGDGLAGLTRAFLSAGAASVVATMWDVADEPTLALVPELYRLRRAGASKVDALRAAQLRLLHALRAGRIRIGGRDGVVLPADPYFWAGFVLVGEP